jgi:hypothetical protein
MKRIARAVAQYISRRQAAKVRAIQAELLLQAKERYEAENPWRASRWEMELWEPDTRRRSSAEIMAEQVLNRRSR